MRISSVTTLRLREYPNLCYVALGTDDELTGIGETFFGARAVAAWVHETAAAYLLGKDPRTIERHSRALEGFVGFRRHRHGEPRPVRRRHCLVGPSRPAQRSAALPIAGGLDPRVGPDLQHVRGADLRARVTRLTGPASEQLVEPPPVANRPRPSSFWAVRSRMVPLRPRVPGQGPARRRDHGDENLALRRVRRAYWGPAHLQRRPRARPGPLPPDPRDGRQ